MANCKSYQNLSSLEKVQMIGEIIHAMQNDEIAFITCKGIISGAKSKGVLNGVTFFPPPDPERFTVRGEYDQLDFDGASYQEALEDHKALTQS